MNTIFEKSQALFGEQAEWFAQHSGKAVETLVSDGETLANAVRSGVEVVFKHQTEFLQAAVEQLKKAGEAQSALLREVFAKKAG